jgi:hypothetical protein
MVLFRFSVEHQWTAADDEDDETNKKERRRKKEEKQDDSVLYTPHNFTTEQFSPTSSSLILVPVWSFTDFVSHRFGSRR